MHYIKHWGLSLLTFLGLNQADNSSLLTHNSALLKKITIVKGDITKQPVDAIVNAANERLDHAGGVALAISKAAGPELQRYCNNIPLMNGQRCALGKAIVTPAFDLRKNGIKNIIHTVGPHGNMPNKETDLANAYKSSLEAAIAHRARTVAFPAISTNIFGYDINKATPVAIAAIIDFLNKNGDKFDEIRLVLFSQNDYMIYKKYLTALKK